MGREISELVNKELNIGEYEVNWNAENVSSGVYYYKLTTENISLIKSMMIIK